MLETLSVRPRICDQIRSGPLGRWVDDFVDVLMTRGYATGTVRACRRMSSATLPRCTCSRPASTWRPSRCGSATSDSKPPINTSRRTCNSRKTLCENSSRSVNERSGSRPTPRCWPSWRASDYDQQTTCWTPTATVSPTVTCHNAMLVILTETGLWSTARCRGRRRHRQANSVRVCSPTSRRVASLRPRSAGRTALTPAPRTLVQTGSCRRCSLIHPLHVVVDVPSVRRSKTNPEGEVNDVRYVKDGVARAIRTLRTATSPEPGDRVVPLSAQMIGLRFTAAAATAGVESRVTAHSGQVGLASELTSRGASTTDVMLAGNWKTSRRWRTILPGRPRNAVPWRATCNRASPSYSSAPHDPETLGDPKPPTIAASGNTGSRRSNRDRRRRFHHLSRV